VRLAFPDVLFQRRPFAGRRLTLEGQAEKLVERTPDMNIPLYHHAPQQIHGVAYHSDVQDAGQLFHQLLEAGARLDRACRPRGVSPLLHFRVDQGTLTFDILTGAVMLTDVEPPEMILQRARDFLATRGVALREQTLAYSVVQGETLVACFPDQARAAQVMGSLEGGVRLVMHAEDDPEDVVCRGGGLTLRQNFSEEELEELEAELGIPL